MRKSIYEEALEKIDVEFDAWDRAEHLELFELVEQALDQAQKQEKLLNQIKEIIDRYEDSYISSMLTESKRYYEIKELIKELEK